MKINLSLLFLLCIVLCFSLNILAQKHLPKEKKVSQLSEMSNKNFLDGFQQSTVKSPTEVLVFADDFEDGELANWTVTNDGGDCVWEALDIEYNNYQLPQTAGGFVLSADASVCYNSYLVISTATLNFVTDASQGPGYQEVRIEWDNDWQVSYYGYWYYDEAHVEYSINGGTNWIPVISYTEFDQRSTHEVWSIQLAGLQSDIRFRLRTIQPGGDTWWAIDNFAIYLDSPVSAAPTAVTNPASNVSETTATLNGNVNPNDSETTVEFEYGLSTSYGTVVTGNPSPIDGTLAINVSANLMGLSPNTSYHFRVNATNGAGISHGIDREFTTSFSYPSTITLNSTYTFGSFTQTNSYKMIGIPGNNNLLINNIIQGNPGRENDWRAFWDPGSGTLDEYDGTSKFNITPGRAFWVLSKNQIVINRLVNTVNLDQDNSYSIPLHTEWNLISNPFEENVSWDDVKNANPGITQPIYYFLSGTYSQPAEFESYKGYYFNNSTGLTSLKIPYVSPGSYPLQKKGIGISNKLDIVLALEGIRKSGITIGFSAEAQTGVDNLDIFSPPDRFADISFAIYNDELETNYKFLKEDYRSEIINGDEFELRLKNETGKNIELQVEEIADYFETYEVYFVDNRLNNVFNLKDTKEIDISGIHKRNNYSLLVGTKQYIENKTSGLLPTEFVLHQNYPNPFNPSTVIRFGVPKQSNITINVYNMLGELVTELIDNQPYQPGYYEIEFIASSAGGGLASGVYVYRIQAGGFIDTKKMILLK